MEAGVLVGLLIVAVWEVQGWTQAAAERNTNPDPPPMRAREKGRDDEQPPVHP